MSSEDIQVKNTDNDWWDIEEEKGRLVKIQKDAQVLTLESKREDDTTYEESFEISDKKSADDYDELRKYIGCFVALILEDGIVVSWRRSEQE